VVGQLESELTEDFCLVFGVRVDQDSRDVSQLVNDGLDLCLAHAPRGRNRERGELVSGFLGFGLGDPRGDDLGVGPGVEGGAVSR
jgi:hypothetical protein